MLCRSVYRGIWAVVLGAGVLLVAQAPALADSAPPAQVLSNFENTYGASLSRDCGFSTPLPANPATSLWLFCDTAIYGLNQQLQYHETGFIPGSTAAEGPQQPGAVPQGLSELPTPPATLPAMPNSDGPAQFLPTPGGLVTSTGQPCDSANGAYAASWIMGVSHEPASANPADVLIAYDNYCVQGTFTFDPEGFGLAEYNPATNKVDRQVTVFTGTNVEPQQMLLSPVFSGTNLYLFGYQCTSRDSFGDCTGGSIYLARTGDTASSWDNPSSYRWRDGGTWTTAAASATSIIPSATPATISAADFSSVGQGVVLIEQTGAGGNFIAYEPVSSLTGSWRQVISASVPCGSSSTGICHALIGHPDLSTTSELMISYFDPAQGPAGHLMADAFPW